MFALPETTSESSRRDPTGPSVLEDRIIEGAGQMAAAQCRWLQQIAELEGAGGNETSEFHSTAAWLSWRCGIHLQNASEYVKVAHALAALPKLSEEFSRGRLSYSQVRVLVRVATPPTEQTLIDLARSSTFGQLSRVVGAYRGVLQAESDARLRQQGRYLHTWFDSDGDFILRGRLSPEDGAAIENALRRTLESLEDPAPLDAATEREQTPGFVLSRHGALQADALVEMAREQLSGGRGGSARASVPEVVVHVDFETLNQGEGECYLEGGPCLAPSTALRLSCDAALVPLIQDGGGNPLSVGRRRRSIPVGLRRALSARDQGCRFPGCQRKAALAGHHAHHWAHGGHTCLDNLCELCPFHHWLVHEGGYSVRFIDGDFQFFRRDGTPVPRTSAPTSEYSGDLSADYLLGETVVEDRAICSEWLGDRLNISYAVGAVLDAQSHGPPS